MLLGLWFIRICFEMGFEQGQNYVFFEQLLSDNKTWYTVKEVAALLGRSEQCVRDCFDNQKMLGHTWNAKAKPGKEKRRTYHISRKCLVLFLMETANYNANDFFDRVNAAEHKQII